MEVTFHDATNQESGGLENVEYWVHWEFDIDELYWKPQAIEMKLHIN